AFAIQELMQGRIKNYTRMQTKFFLVTVGRSLHIRTATTEQTLSTNCKQERKNMNDELNQERTGGDAQTKSVPPDRAGGDMDSKDVIGDRTGGDAQTKGVGDFRTE